MNPMGHQFFDNTILSCYKECPRKFYLRHRLSLASRSRSAALDFGLAWHTALETLWVSRSTGEAMNSFLKTWTEECSRPWPEPLGFEGDKKRNPQRASAMIEAYAAERQHLMDTYELLGNEQAFAVPLGDGMFYIGRLDKVLRAPSGAVTVLEHKTTTSYSIQQGFQPSFVEQWSPNSQIDGYLYAIRRLFPDAHTELFVDAALVHNKETRFKLIPTGRQSTQVDGWLEETRDWISRLKAEVAFPRLTNSCYSVYGSCQFVDICRFSKNPCDLIVEDTHDFEEVVWEPYPIEMLMEHIEDSPTKQMDIWGF